MHPPKGGEGKERLVKKEVRTIVISELQVCE